MKKLLLSALGLVGLISFSIAQTAPAKAATTPVKAKMDVVKKDAKTVTPAKVVTMQAPKPAATPVAAKPAVAAAPLKKDGTPDKRFKTNQAASGPLKKDGTKDMRFKANKKS